MLRQSFAGCGSDELRAPQTSGAVRRFPTFLTPLYQQSLLLPTRHGSVKVIIYLRSSSMPRARVPDARSLASTGSPLLPLLAPRVFVEAPLLVRGARHNVLQPQKVLEKREISLKHHVSISPTLRSRYAHIFRFARQQLRSYTTAADSSEPARASDSTFSDEQRIKRRYYNRRLMLFRMYEAPQSRQAWRRHGKYRSLRRRAFNYSNGRRQILDMRICHRNPNQFTQLDAVFTFLDRKVHPQLTEDSLPLELRHNPLCPIWAAQVFGDGQPIDTEQLWNNWSRADLASAERRWRHLLIYLLDKSPDKALQFIQALVYKSRLKSLRRDVIADAFEYLSTFFVREELWDREMLSVLKQSRTIFLPTFYHVMGPYIEKHKYLCSQLLLYNFTKLAQPGDLERITDLLLQSDAYLEYDTLLHYAHTFGEAGEHTYALRCLKRITEQEQDPSKRQVLVKRDRFMQTCALVLRKSVYRETPGIVAAIAELGVKLDLLPYNVIISNAVEAGDMSTAFQVYNTLEDNDLKPDKFTFSTLLHGCVMADGPGMYREFAEYCAQAAEQIKDPWLATEYLHFLYVCHYGANEGLPPEGNELLQAYVRFFSIHPLVPFWSVESTTGLRKLGVNTDANTVKMEPSSMALYLMLQVEIRKAAADGNERLPLLYNQFVNLVQLQHDSVLSELATQPIVWNAFLLAFCQKQQFDHASQLIKYMEQAGIRPNVYSWNIFTQAFFKLEQDKPAERLLELMRNRSIKPDRWTHGIQLRGHVRMKKVDKVGSVLPNLEETDLMDPELLKNMAKIRDRNRLMLRMEEATKQREQKVAAEVQEKAEAVKARWKAPIFIPTLSLQQASKKENRENVSKAHTGHELQQETTLEGFVNEGRRSMRIRRVVIRRHWKRVVSRVQHGFVKKSPIRRIESNLNIRRVESGLNIRRTESRPDIRRVESKPNIKRVQSKLDIKKVESNPI